MPILREKIIVEPIANLAALKAFVVTPISSGVVAEVISMSPFGGLFTWVATSAATPDDVNVVLPTGHVGNGRWIRADMLGLQINSSGKIVASQLDIAGPFTPKGTLTIAADFPTLATVQDGWTYTVATQGLIDNDPTKTNTGQTFNKGDMVYWYGAGLVKWNDITGIESWIDDGTDVYPLNARNIKTNQNIKLPTTSATVGQIKWNDVANIHTYGTDNFFAGVGAGNLTLTSINTVAIGKNAGILLTSGSHNTMVGYWSGINLLTGNYNSFFGWGAGGTCTGAESSNILIGNAGQVGDNNIIKIGTQGAGNAQQNKCYIAGVYNTASGSASQYLVYVDANGQLQSALTANTDILNLATSSVTAGQIKWNGSIYIHTFGVDNSFFGRNSGNFTLSGNYNACYGYNTGHAITTGYSNTFIGLNAGSAVTTGYRNTFIGNGAAQALTTGNYNTALGYAAGLNYTGAESSNVMIANRGTLAESNVIRIGTQGSGEEQQNKAFIAGIYNTATGSASKYMVYIDSNGQLQSSDIAKPNNIDLPTTSSTVGQIKWNNVTFIHTYNSGVFIGSATGNYTMSGTSNTVIGNSSGVGLTSGYTNVICGSNSGNHITQGYRNSIFGVGAADNLITGNYNICAGYMAGSSLTGAESSNILIGSAGTIGVSNIIKIGIQGGSDQQQNKCYIAGIYNTATGSASQYQVYVDSNGQLQSSTTANTDVLALPTTSSTVGQIKWNNVAYVHTYGTDNIFFGATAGNFTLSGQGNTGYGNNSLHGLTSGTYNSMSGYHSGQGITSGNSNSALGNSALANLTTGSSNIAIGYAAGLGYTGAEGSNIILGHGGVTGESHVIRIGTQGAGAGEQSDTYLAGKVHHSDVLDINESYGVTNKIFDKKFIKKFSAVTAFATQITITPSTKTNLYVSGYVEAKLSGYTATVADSGVCVARWAFKYANAAPTVVKLDEVLEANSPKFQLAVSGDNVVLQVSSSNATNNCNGSLVYEIFIPDDNGAGVATFTLS